MLPKTKIKENLVNVLDIIKIFKLPIITHYVNIIIPVAKKNDVYPLEITKLLSFAKYL